jgi:hypothetical protein
VKPLVYVETSVVSYLTARTSSNLVTAARQAWTSQWWEIAPQYWELRISELVVREATRGDSQASQRRLAALESITTLEITKEARVLAVRLVETGAVPASEPEDALHIAVASVSKANFLLSWNFAHLAGPRAKMRLLDNLRAMGAHVPLLTTPEELMES